MPWQYELMQGKSSVVSIKRGASSAVKDIRESIEFVESFDNVVLCFDNDKAGIEAARQVARILKPSKAKIINLPQSLLEKIIRLNKVKVNKKKVKSSYRLESGDIVEVYNISNFNIENKPKISKYRPSKKEVSVYDDYIIEDNENFVVINKPTGIPVQSGTKSFRNIIDVIKNTKYFEHHKPFIVHRLDKETSGILIVAKTREYAQLFTSLFRIRKIHKTYLALTHGKISKRKDTLKDDLVSYEKNRKIIQKAISHLKVLKSNNDYSYVELNPIT